MAIKVASLYAELSLSKSGFDSGLSSARSKLKSFGSTAITAVGGGIAAGATLATAALAGVSIAGLKSFGDFESGMNEVFTLLPGISQSAMDQMKGDVKSFATEMGVLPRDAIPALYQALSAGVPPENVFDFLSTSQMAALGGVTDLTTAVDGISSVVNSYGSEVISATEASDAMFTAVRLGKTTFGELSSSLFNVTPISSALGVNFETVTAALAAMTAQGVPTSVASRQLRQMLTELSKSSSQTAKTFQELSGQSFSDFIANGGSVQEALALLSSAAEDSGVGIQDLFSSVEAGNAALALTGNGADAFSSALDEMAGSAGATEAAYNQMDQGLDRSFKKLGVMASNMLNTVGEALAPTVGSIVDDLLPSLNNFGDWFTETGGPRIQNFVSNAASNFKEFITKAKPIWEDFEVKMSEVVGPTLDMVKDAIERITTALGINTEETNAQSLALDALKVTLDAVVIGVEAVGIAFQGIAWVTEQIRAAVDSARALGDQLGRIGDILSSGNFNLLGGIAGGLGAMGLNVPGFATGGMIPGPIGSPQLVLAHGGETVSPNHLSGGQSTTNLTININSTNADEARRGVTSALRAAGII